MRIPTNTDVAKLLNAAEPPSRPRSRPGFTAYVALCAFAGLRRGEALGVQVGDIDFLGRTLKLARQLQRAKPADIAAGKDLVKAAGGITVMVRTPKYESERTIYLPDELVTILAEHVRQHTSEGEPSRWLFDEDGKPWHDNLVDYRWRSTRTDGGTKHKLHDLRHYFASGLIAAGCDVVTVQRAMGHASATTTLSTYAHLWPTAEDKTRAAVSEMAAAVLATHLPRTEVH
jgi:integrase